jgi:hypothetical protein
MAAMQLKKVLIGICAAAAVAVLAGCASPYGPRGATGGYTDTKLADNVWRVAFYGNGNTGEDTVWKYWLHRCAEVTLQNGYSYFSVVPDRKSWVPPYDLNPGEHARLSGDSGPHVPAQYITFYTITTYSKTADVVMYRTRAGALTREQAYALHAQTVLDMLKPYMASGGKEAGPPRKEIIEAAMLLAPVPAVPK